MRQIEVRQRLLRDLPWLCAAGITAYSAVIVAVTGFGYDAHAYWLTAHGPLYRSAPNTPDAFLYSPAFAQAVRPLALLPWPVFCGLWLGAAGLVLALLLRPLGWQRALPLWLCCSPEIVSGNVFWLFAVVVAFGLRRPWLWVLPALTKITPALGPVWFLVRGQWRALGLSVLATVAVVGVSYGLEPSAWHDWVGFLGGYLGSTTTQVGALAVPPVVRIPVAVALVAWGAWRDRPWVLPVGMILASPVFGSSSLVVLAGLPFLLGRSPADVPRLAGEPVGDRGQERL